MCPMCPSNTRDSHNGFLLQLFQSKTYNRIASIPTILISAVFHEYVLWAPVRFVLPVLLCMFSSFGGEQFGIQIALGWFHPPPMHTHSVTCVLHALPTKQILELLYAHSAQPGCIDHGVLLCYRVLCQEEVCQRRKLCEHIYSTVL